MVQHAKLGAIDCRTQSEARRSNFWQQHSTWLKTALWETETPGGHVGCFSADMEHWLHCHHAIHAIIIFPFTAPTNINQHQPTHSWTRSTGFHEAPMFPCFPNVHASFGAARSTRGKQHVHLIGPEARPTSHAKKDESMGWEGKWYHVF